MIITRTPFRISFSGGGSDLSVFYEKHGGCVISTTIDKYMYISLHPAFHSDEIILKYSKTETVKDYSEIEHQYYRYILDYFKINGVEITSTADMPTGTGMGSSSAFTVGLLLALNTYESKFVSKEYLASTACEMEIEGIKQPIGKQDQYAAAYGGLNYYEFQKDGAVMVYPIIMDKWRKRRLEENLMLFYVGGKHSAGEILKEQGKNVISGEREKNQLRMCELTRILRDELNNGNIDALGDIMHENWQLKKTLASNISNSEIDEIYDVARDYGACGGKLLGAGGGGFILLYVPLEKQDDLREKLKLKNIKFHFDLHGSMVLYTNI